MQHGEWDEPWVSISTCLVTLDICVNRWLENALYEELPSEPNGATSFDIWFHGILLSSKGYSHS